MMWSIIRHTFLYFRPVMMLNSRQASLSRSDLIIRSLCVLLLIVGGLVTLGWLVNSETIKDIFFHQSFLSALSFILLAAALWLITQSAVRVSRALLGLIVLITALRLIEIV